MLCEVSLIFPLAPYPVLLTCEILEISASLNGTVYTVISSSLRKFKGLLENIILPFNRFLEYSKISTNFKYSLLSSQTKIQFSKCNVEYKCI